MAVDVVGMSASGVDVGGDGDVDDNVHHVGRVRFARTMDRRSFWSFLRQIAIVDANDRRRRERLLSARDRRETGVHRYRKPTMHRRMIGVYVAPARLLPRTPGADACVSPEQADRC